MKRFRFEALAGSLLLLLLLAAAGRSSSQPATAARGSSLAAGVGDDGDGDNGPSVKGLNVSSLSREIASFVAKHGKEAEDGAGTVPFAPELGDGLEDLANVQVNDPALDNIQVFPGTRPFEEAVQSETTLAAFGDDIVVGYNSSANQPVIQTPRGLAFVRRQFSGFSVSHDGGETWTSGFVPPVPDTVFTFGDPVVAVDRSGNFFYASFGTNAAGNDAVIINESTDRGSTFAPAIVVALDPGADKDWFAIGPDPFVPARDNLYLTWTSFQFNAAGNSIASQLRFARSTDGGATWTAQRTLFAPVDQGPTGMSAFIQFSNPVVDASNGRLYIPFLHFSNFDSDFIKVLVSDDAGETFRFLRFDVRGAPDPFGFPNVTPGIVSDCGSPGGGIRLVLHQGTDLGGGRFGLPRFRQSTRLITQPSAAAADGKLFIAINSSTSQISGDPAAGSEIRLLFSLDGGRNFSPPVTVARATAADPQHVHPFISADREGETLHITYYVQQADGRIRVDSTRVEVTDRTVRFDLVAPVSSVAFNLTPSNNPIPTKETPFRTTNFDRTVRACYDLGEYLGTTLAHKGLLAAWGDDRNPWTSPPGSPAAGTHSQEDVFFQVLER